jgi:large subunit ribosomal protein L23
MHLYEVLRRPLITEKNTGMQTLNKYAFEIADGANKMMIKDAVEKAFKVKVTAINVITVRGKAKKMGRRLVHASPWKKAIVTLRPGDKIEYFEGV